MTADVKNPTVVTKNAKKVLGGTISKKQKHDDLPNCLESSQKKFGGHTTKITDC